MDSRGSRLTKQSPPLGPRVPAPASAPAEVDGWNDERFDGEGDRARAMRDGDDDDAMREDEDDDDAMREDDGEVRARETTTRRATRRERGCGGRKFGVSREWVTRAGEGGGVEERCERVGMGGGGEMRSVAYPSFVAIGARCAFAGGDGGGRARRGERERERETDRRRRMSVFRDACRAKAVSMPKGVDVSATGASLKDWTPSSWRQRKALQQPMYEDEAELAEALATIQTGLRWFSRGNREICKKSSRMRLPVMRSCCSVVIARRASRSSRRITCGTRIASCCKCPSC